jgi:hypothetical protein
MERLNAWYTSTEYQPLMALRKESTDEKDIGHHGRGCVEPLQVCPILSFVNGTSRCGVGVPNWHQVWMPSCPAHGRYRTSSGPQPGAYVQGLWSRIIRTERNKQHIE